jgi:hypothetical protein
MIFILSCLAGATVLGYISAYENRLKQQNRLKIDSIGPRLGTYLTATVYGGAYYIGVNEHPTILQAAVWMTLCSIVLWLLEFFDRRMKR